MKTRTKQTMAVFMALALVLSVVHSGTALAQSPYKLITAAPSLTTNTQATNPVTFDPNSLQLVPSSAPAPSAPSVDSSIPTSAFTNEAEIEMINGITAEIRRAHERLDGFNQKFLGYEQDLREVIRSQQSSLSELQRQRESVESNTELALAAREDARAANERAALAEAESEKTKAAALLAQQQAAEANQRATDAEAKSVSALAEAQQARGQAATALARARAADAAARPKGIGKLISWLIPPLRHR